MKYVSVRLLGLTLLAATGMLLGVSAARADKPTRSELPDYSSSQFQADDNGLIQLASANQTNQAITLDVEWQATQLLPSDPLPSNPGGETNGE